MSAMTPDPFDVLRRTDEPIAPPARFATRASPPAHRRAATRSPPRRRPCPPSPPPTPSPTSRPTSMTVTPYLIVEGRAAALDFYRDAFGAVEHHRLVDERPRRPRRDQHRRQQADAGRRVPGARHPRPRHPRRDRRAASPSRSPTSTRPSPALSSSAPRRGREPADQFHGNRTANIVDPGGQAWMLLAKIGDLSAEQYAANAAERGYTVEGESATTTEHLAARSTSSSATASVTCTTSTSPSLIPPAPQPSTAVLGWEFRRRTHRQHRAPPGSVGNYFTVDQGGIRMWFVVDDIQAAVRQGPRARRHGRGAESQRVRLERRVPRRPGHPVLPQRPVRGLLALSVHTQPRQRVRT